MGSRCHSLQRVRRLIIGNKCLVREAIISICFKISQIVASSTRSPVWRVQEYTRIVDGSSGTRSCMIESLRESRKLQL